MWSRIHLTPVMQAEEDRDQARRHFADKAREKELLGAETKVYNSDRSVYILYLSAINCWSCMLMWYVVSLQIREADFRVHSFESFEIDINLKLLRYHNRDFFPIVICININCLERRRQIESHDGICSPN